MNLEILALDTATPQIRAPGAGDGYVANRAATFNQAVSIFNSLTNQVLSDLPTATFRRFSSTQTSNVVQVQDESNNVLAAFNAIGRLTLPAIMLSGNISAPAWTTSGIGLAHTARTLTDTTSSGTVAAAYTNVLGGNTIAASSATTFTEYASLQIGNPSAGTNVTITNPYSLVTAGAVKVANGTLTTSQPTLDLSQTWNASGTTFTGIKANFTSTASASGSLPLDIQVGNASIFTIRKDGQVVITSSAATYALYAKGTTRVDGNIDFYGAAFLTYKAAASLQLGAADAAAPVAQTLTAQSVVAGTSNTAAPNLTIAAPQGTGSGNGGSHLFSVAPAGSSGTAQNALYPLFQMTASKQFYIYNTTDTTTNYERAKIAWSSNVLQIGTEKAGTGSARALELQTDGTTRLTIGTQSGASNTITTSAQLFAGTVLGINNLFYAECAASGIIVFRNWAGNDFNRLQFGGTTSSFPALKRSSASLIVRLADDSANAALESASLKTDAPTTGTSGTWKLGSKVAATTTLDTTGYIEVDIGGTLYKVALVTS